jgi:hypothetical protein
LAGWWRRSSQRVGASQLRAVPLTGRDRVGVWRDWIGVWRALSLEKVRTNSG